MNCCKHVPGASDKRRRGPFMLPASFLYINWILVFLILMGATAVIAMYAAMIAFQGGSALVGKWVISMIGSIFMSIFLVQPLKVKHYPIHFRRRIYQFKCIHRSH